MREPRIDKLVISMLGNDLSRHTRLIYVQQTSPLVNLAIV